MNRAVSCIDKIERNEMDTIAKQVHGERCVRVKRTAGECVGTGRRAKSDGTTEGDGFRRLGLNLRGINKMDQSLRG